MLQASKTQVVTRQSAYRRREEVKEIVSRCVHCGLCNAACPTYALAGDERDGPRGRITMISTMFDGEQAKGLTRSMLSAKAPTDEVRKHVGRCLSCMACMTACPAGVDYGHLVGHAKALIRETTMPTVRERLVNWFAGRIIPYPDRLKWMLAATPLASRLRWALRWLGLGDFGGVIDNGLKTRKRRAAFSGPGTAATKGERRGRVIMLAGCAQQVLRPGINDATIRLFARNGFDVEVAPGAGCCGRAASQTGDVASARNFARANIDAWLKALRRDPAAPIDAIVFNSAGCGAEVKDYPHLLRDDPAYSARAAEIAALAEDVTEFLGNRGLRPPRRWSSLKVAYQGPCALRHGQGVISQPSDLIHEAGFSVIELPEGDMCCGAGGSYAFKEPEIAHALRERKVDHILALRPDVIATNSIACLKHIEPAVGTPIVHTIELLDWAHGGPVPRGLEGLSKQISDVPGPPPLNIEDYIQA